MSRIGELIYERITQAYPSAGYRSLRKLAERVGIAPSTISGWRELKNAPSSEYMRRIAQALRVTEEYLLGEQSLDEARVQYERIASLQFFRKTRQLPLVMNAQDVVELSIHVVRKTGWKGETIEVPDAMLGDAAVRVDDESMFPPLVPGTYVVFRKQSEVPLNSIVVLQKQDGTICIRISQMRNARLVYVPTNPNYMSYAEDDVKVVGLCTGIIHLDAGLLARYAKPVK
jgi:SOS-response transcriptional repressor LexA